MRPFPSSFQTAELDDVIVKARAADGYAAEVLHSELLSVGLYLLPAGGMDDQTPHHEDEVYYAVSGRAMLRVGEEDHPVRPGTLLVSDLYGLIFLPSSSGAPARNAREVGL